MSKAVIIFNKVLRRPEFNYTGMQIVEWSGLHKSAVSRFLNGKVDISVSKFFHIISSMPTAFQQVYWSELLNLELEEKPQTWQSLISQASHTDMEEIFNAIAHRWSALENPKKRELAGV